MTDVTFNTFRSLSAAVYSSASRPLLRDVVAPARTTDRTIARMTTDSTIVDKVTIELAPSGLTMTPPADKISPQADSAALLKSQGQNQTV